MNFSSGDLIKIMISRDGYKPIMLNEAFRREVIKLIDTCEGSPSGCKRYFEKQRDEEIDSGLKSFKSGFQQNGEAKFKQSLLNHAASLEVTNKTRKLACDQIISKHGDTNKCLSIVEGWKQSLKRNCIYTPFSILSSDPYSIYHVENKEYIIPIDKDETLQEHKDASTCIGIEWYKAK